MIKRFVALLLAAAAIVGTGLGLSWGVRSVVEATAESTDIDVPTTTVRRGRVTITVPARGELQGGRSESLIVPMAGSPELAIVYLPESGAQVEPGDVVVEFDTTQQEFDLREAEADLLEAEQQVLRAEAEARAKLEEARYQVLSTEAEVNLAELEMRTNELLATIRQRENEIALERARNRHRQAQRNLENQEPTAGAGIDIQKAAVNKAALLAESARRKIANMTLWAKSSGYLHVLGNRNAQSIFFPGMDLPPFQVGDSARAGQAVAQIPDMSKWEVRVGIPEADRGYLEIGQPVTVQPVAVPGRDLRGHIAVLGGSAGFAWDRAFECRIALDETDPGLRPGMTANVLITVESLDDVLWIPSQALFESDGRTFVYRRTPDGYITHDVTLLRRSESQAVIAGIEEATPVALARPGQQIRTDGSGQDGVLQALPQ